MQDDLTVTIIRDGRWVVAWCREVPGANGQGESEAEAMESLRKAIALIREDQDADDADRRVRPILT